jgi:transposase
LAVRQQRAAPILAAFDNWMREKQQRISGKGDTASALNCALEPWQALSRYASDGRLAIDNNPAERS